MHSVLNFIAIMIVLLVVNVGCDVQYNEKSCSSIVGRQHSLISSVPGHIVEVSTLTEENRGLWLEGDAGECPGAINVDTSDGKSWIIFTKVTDGPRPFQAIYAIESGTDIMQEVAPPSRSNGQKVIYKMSDKFRRPEDATSLFAYAHFESHTVLYSYENGRFSGYDPEG